MFQKKLNSQSWWVCRARIGSQIEKAWASSQLGCSLLPLLCFWKLSFLWGKRGGSSRTSHLGQRSVGPRWEACRTAGGGGTVSVDAAMTPGEPQQVAVLVPLTFLPSLINIFIFQWLPSYFMHT